MHEDKPLTVKTAAEYLSVRPETIRRWLKEGKIHGAMPGGTRSGYRIPPSEILRILDGRGIGTDDDSTGPRAAAGSEG